MTGERGPSAADNGARDDNRDPAGADRVTPRERRSRWLLRAYPAEYRRERGEELIGTLLETTPDGRTWPRMRDVRALATGGLRARAAQNRHRTTVANLRVAMMAGVALFLAFWVARYLSSVAGASTWHAWPAALTGLLIATTVLLAWITPRFIALTGALAAAAAVSYFALARGHLVGPAVIQLVCLAGLVALIPRTERPSRRWLWLVGLIAALVLLASVAPGSAVLASFFRLAPGAVVLAIVLATVAWIAVDARPAIAFITYFVLSLVQSGTANIRIAGYFAAQLPLLLITAAIAALAVWLLRRQSARAPG
jgi:hypothetical protein